MKQILLVVMLLGCTYALKAQTACTQTLRQARTVYDEGRIHELPSLLESCLKKGFTQEERTEAYRLLILSYIYLDEPTKADETMLALLRDNPEFQINPAADPAELINLYATFRTKPIFLFGLKLEANYTLVNVIESYGLHNLNDSQGEYTPNFGFGGSLIIEKEFIERITGRFEASFVVNSFTYSNSYLSESSSENIAAPEAIETQSWLGASILGQYRLLASSGWNPYVTIGPTVNYLFADDLAAETAVSGGEQATGTSLDLKGDKEMRKNLNFMISAGAGVKKKVGKLYFIASARYSYGLFNITEKHYDNELSLKYGMALNDISTSYATISLGLLFQQFSPKKLTK